MHVFTSGRDYRPHTAIDRLPPNTVYARVLVAADDAAGAVAALERAGLGRYGAALREPSGADGPAEAIAEHVRGTGRTDPAVFVLYRLDTDALGESFAAPLFPVAVLRPDRRPATIGRVRVVDMGRPTDPHPVCRIVPDDGAPDPVPMPAATEGPDPHVELVEGPAAFPAGALGFLSRQRERRLLQGLDAARDDLGRAIAAIDRARISADPRVSWGRQADALLALSHRLAGLAMDAAVVEAVLQAGE